MNVMVEIDETVVRLVVLGLTSEDEVVPLKLADDGGLGISVDSAEISFPTGNDALMKDKTFDDLISDGKLKVLNDVTEVSVSNMVPTSVIVESFDEGDLSSDDYTVQYLSAVTTIGITNN